MEFDEQGPSPVPSDAKTARGAKLSADRLSTYEGLVTEDIYLPALEAKIITLKGKAIHLPAQGAAHINRRDTIFSLEGLEWFLFALIHLHVTLYFGLKMNEFD